MINDGCICCNSSEYPEHMFLWINYPSIIVKYPPYLFHWFGHQKLKIWTTLLYHRVMHPKDAEEMASSVDLDQTALIWVYTVCPDLPVQKFRLIMGSPWKRKWARAWQNMQNDVCPAKAEISISDCALWSECWMLPEDRLSIPWATSETDQTAWLAGWCNT